MGLMDLSAHPLSPDEQDRVAALLARFVQNYEKLQQAGTLADMETTVFSPGADDGRAEALGVLRAMRPTCGILSSFTPNY
jgi:hypothetical protein